MSDTLGEITVTATATDAAGNTVTVPRVLRVVDPNDGDPPQLTLTSLVDGQVVRAPIDIVGTITDNVAELLTYELTATPFNGGPTRVIATGSGPLDNQTLGQFDPTILANGPYQIDLIATDAGGNRSVESRTVNVAGNLKLGNFTVSFTDVTIPVAGIPITIGRTYDTLNANTSGDFGYGWSLDLKDARAEVDLSTVGTQGFDGYPAFVDGTRVKVTMPDGTTEGFTFKAVAGASVFGHARSWHPSFLADDGNTTSLETPAVDLYRLGNEYVDGYGRTYNPADAMFGNEYTLTTYPDRLKRIINARINQRGQTSLFSLRMC
jgi:hypothetical protein